MKIKSINFKMFAVTRVPCSLKTIVIFFQFPIYGYLNQKEHKQVLSYKIWR